MAILGYNTTASAATDSNAAGVLLGNKFTLANAVRITAGHLWARGKASSDTQMFRLAIYADNAGALGALKLVSSEFQVTYNSGTIKWWDTVHDVELPAGTYYPVVLYGTVGAGGAYTYLEADGGSTVAYYDTEFWTYHATNDPPDPGGAFEDSTAPGYELLLYFDYEDASPAVRYPTVTSTTNATAPYDDINWTSIANITVDDTSYASITSSSFDANVYSYMAKAQGFSFNIPTDATIDGIVVQTLGATYAGITAADWKVMQLLNASGTAEGDNNAADGGTLNLTSDATDTFGGAADKWGVALTPAMANDADFGVQFALMATAANTDIRIEYLKMTVYFSTAGTATGHNLMLMGVG